MTEERMREELGDLFARRRFIYPKMSDVPPLSRNPAYATVGDVVGPHFIRPLSHAAYSTGAWSTCPGDKRNERFVFLSGSRLEFQEIFYFRGGGDIASKTDPGERFYCLFYDRDSQPVSPKRFVYGNISSYRLICMCGGTYIQWKAY